MSNSYKSVEQIVSETPSINTFLINANQYYAHITPKNIIPALEPETLAQHIDLVQKKCVLLCKIHQLDGIIDGLIYSFVKNNFEDTKQIEAGNFLKKLFVNVVVFHDYGKINENFQAHPDKMNNPHFRLIDSPLSTHHSALGAYLFIVKHFQEFYGIANLTNEDRLIYASLVLAFSYPIFRHHAKHLKDKIEEKITFSKKEIDTMKKYIVPYQFQIHDNFSANIPANTAKFFEHIKNAQAEDSLKQSFELYSLVRLSFSLLTASDYMASGEYMSGGILKLDRPEDFGILSRERVNQLFENVQKEKDYNFSTYQKLANYQFIKPTTSSNENLNTLRQEMAIEVIQNIRQNKDKNLFYIEAPTGGGKTNLSMIAAVELLKANENLNKVFYVFPFTTLVTQTHKAIIETLGLESEEVVQLHSKAGFQTKEEEKDGEYGNEKKNYIDNLFVNYPFCLLTHIKFFDILKTNEKETNYLLHRLANSVVVIDELQSYNPSHWDKIIYFIRNYAHFYKIKFILMSATLPKLDKLKILKGQVNDFVYLLPNAKKDYFQNANFSQRVNFKFDLLQDKTLDLSILANVLFEKSKEYAQRDFGKAKPKDSVYTIIEFIFKKSATEFYKEIEKIQEQSPFFDEIFVLSGTILEHRRRYIIDFLKDTENRKKKILLITTQVVEAGVDIDMDLGFKNKSLIDSDEQLAGRINRNVNKEDCELYIFKINEPSRLYHQDMRYTVTKEKLKQSDYEEILAHKNFDKLYDLVLEGIDKWNGTMFSINFGDYEMEMQNLNFQSVHQNFKLIEQENLSIFVPLAISTENNNFSKNEIEFLKKAAIFSNAQNEVEGSEVFDLYIALVENKKMDFIDKKIGLKILQGIMSKFIFSVFDDSKGATRRNLIRFADIGKTNNPNLDKENDGTTYGFVYLANYKQIYDEIFGLDESQFDNTDNQIL